MKGAFRSVKVSGWKGVYRRGERYHINFRDAGGVLRWRVVGEDLEAAARARDEILALAKRGIRLPGKSISVNELCERWLDRRANAHTQSLSERTYSRYSEITRLQIRPRLGKQLVRNIDRFAIAAFVEDLRASGLAPTTQGLVLKTLNRLLAYGVESGFHGYNPVAEFQVAKPTIGPPSTGDLRRPSMPRTLDEDELKRLLAAAAPAWRPAFTLVATAGLRTAELLALEWRDIESGVVRIQRQRRRDGKLHRFGKSDPRRREIPILDVTGLEQTFNLHNATARGDLLVGGTAGARTARSLDLALRSAANRAGLVGKVTASVLRDTYAARLIYDSVDCLSIARQLGHRSFDTTYRRYIAIFALAGRLEEAQGARREGRRPQAKPAKHPLPPVSSMVLSGKVEPVPIDEVATRTGRRLEDIEKYGDSYFEIRGKSRREMVLVPVELLLRS